MLFLLPPLEDDVAHPGRHRVARSTRCVATLVAVAGLGLGLLGVVGTGGFTSAFADPGPGTSSGSSTDEGESRSGAPCETTIKACARLSTREVWITDGAGTVLRGPMPMNHGDDENPTPTGTFHVQRKSEHHVSQEREGVPMPFSVFFDGHGRAFHQGDPERQSVGCVRMNREDARWVFQNLEVGDPVQIVR